MDTFMNTTNENDKNKAYTDTTISKHLFPNNQGHSSTMVKHTSVSTCPKGEKPRTVISIE